MNEIMCEISCGQPLLYDSQTQLILHTPRIYQSTDFYSFNLSNKSARDVFYFIFNVCFWIFPLLS